MAVLAGDEVGTTLVAAPKHARRRAPGVTTAAPLTSSLLARLAQVAVLATVSRLHFHGVAAAVSGFGLVSSFAIITDSGFANYLLSTHAGTVPRQEYRQGLRYHALLAIAGATAAVGSVAIIGRHELTPLVMELVIAFGVTQVGDSLSRTARAPYLSLTRPGRFSVPELASTLLKVPIIVLALAFRSPYWLLFLPVASTLVAAVAIASSHADLTDSRDVARLTGKTLWAYTASNSISALYSQAPVVIAGFFLGTANLAQLTLVYRTIQPTELLPATITQQMIPSLRTAPPARIRRTWLIFVGIGAAAWVAIVACTPLINALYGVRVSLLPLLIIAGAGLPLKYGNYALVAGLVARGYIKKRLRSSLVAGIVAVALVGAAAAFWGAREVLAGVVVAEAVLTALLLRVTYSIAAP